MMRVLSPLHQITLAMHEPLRGIPMPPVAAATAVATVAALWLHARAWPRAPKLGRRLALAGAGIGLFALVVDLLWMTPSLSQGIPVDIWLRLALRPMVEDVLLICVLYAAVMAFYASRAAPDPLHVERRAESPAEGQVDDALASGGARDASGGRLLAFYAPVVLIGGFAAMPLVSFVALAVADRFLDMPDPTYGSAVLFSTLLLPAILGFGTDLKFNSGRFGIGLAMAGFAGVQAAVRGGAMGRIDLHPFAAAAGVIALCFVGLAVTAALGQAGLWLADRAGGRGNA